MRKIFLLSVIFFISINQAIAEDGVRIVLKNLYLAKANYADQSTCVFLDLKVLTKNSDKKKILLKKVESEKFRDTPSVANESFVFIKKRNASDGNGCNLSGLLFNKGIEADEKGIIRLDPFSSYIYVYQVAEPIDKDVDLNFKIQIDDKEYNITSKAQVLPYRKIYDIIKTKLDSEKKIATELKEGQGGKVIGRKNPL